MRKLPTILPHKTTTGFALIENLIAIVLFTVGALGIAASTATAIKVNGDNQARAMAMAVATKTLESVYIEATKPGNNDTSFATRLKTYVATTAYDGITVQGNVAAGSGDDFTVSIIEAWDSGSGTARKNVLTTVGPYVSPVTVAVRVTYVGNAGGGAKLDDPQEYFASFTYVLTQVATP